MRLLIASILLLAAKSRGADPPETDQAWMREGLSAQISKFQSTTFTPHPNQKTICAVNSQSEMAWWSTLRVLHHTGDKIDWLATLPKDYLDNRGHYLLDCGWRHLEKLDMWVLEVFDSTHMGNGCLWLFALEGHELRLLLHTPAVGRHWQPAPDLAVPPDGEARFLGRHLSIEYRRPSGADFETVCLTGTIAVVDPVGKELPSKPYAATWTWDPSERIFTRSQP